MLDTGSMMAMFKQSVGRMPDLIMGKPYPFTVDYVCNRLGVNPGEIAFVGDRLETDIRIGVMSGLKTALVYTGVTSPEQYRMSSIRASREFRNIGELGALLLQQAQ